MTAKMADVSYSSPCADAATRSVKRAGLTARFVAVAKRNCIRWAAKNKILYNMTTSYRPCTFTASNIRPKEKLRKTSATVKCVLSLTGDQRR